MNVSDKLLDLSVIRQLLLERVIAGQSVQLNKQLDAIAAALEKQLKGKELSEYQGKRLDKAVAELKAVIDIKAPDLAELGVAEAEFFRDAMASVGIDAVLPPISALESIAQGSLVQGATIGNWFSRLNESTRFDVERTVKNGVSLGQTNAQIAKSIMGIGDKGGEPIAKSRRDAMAITRTAVQTVAKDARLASLEANADIIKAVQWVSTLDSRTSDICIVRSGKTWTYPDFKPIKHKIPWNGGPPAHWNCRSTFIPITKSFEELSNGRIKDNVEPSTRASMDGYVAADLTFDAFLRSKPPEFADQMLGKGRAELWRSGKITLNQLLDQRGNPLTLAELRSQYGAASVAAKPTIEPQQPPKRIVNAPAFNPEVNADTIKVIPRKEAQKILTAQFALGAADPAYLTESRIVYRGIKQDDIGKSNLSTAFSDEAMSMFVALKPELDDLAARFGLPKLRGFKTTKSSNTVGSMGDGIMFLNPQYFTSYAANVGEKSGASVIARLEDANDALRATLRGYSSRLDAIDEQLRSVSRASPEYSQLWLEKSAVVKEYNKLAAEVNKNSKILQLNRRNNVLPSSWKPGDDVEKRPFGVEHYMDNGVDRARSVLFHEFAHHLHQMYGKTTSRRSEAPPIEKRLVHIWAKKSKSERDKQASKYSTTDGYEWFAENFALYMMGKRDLVDPDAIKLIEELLNDQAN
jgi:SPP1 gp7 family putative phage head morphogenesis protein